jgi:cell division protein YceG involved in septum cleavage
MTDPTDPHRRNNMNVYVTMIEDRHSDPEPYVFSTAEAAIAYARACAREYAHSPDDVQETNVEGWLYSATYSVEGDSVRVVEKTIDEKADAR